MNRRIVPAVLLALLLVLQGQLWFGRGSIPNVARLSEELAAQRRSNARADQVNQRMEAEIRDLREGLEIVEEKARAELGMVRPNEIFVQLVK
jgi:cell division protein FtsB